MEASTILARGAERRGSRVPLSRLGDEGLARVVGKGGEWAFAALYDRYRDVLYRYCRSILRHDADAQDALQATFAAAYGALCSGRRDAPLRPWLFRIAHNQAITSLRQRRAHHEVPDDLIGVGADVEARVAEREQLQQLVADLRALPDRQRSALVMRELSGLSHDEIAVALGVSTAAAKQTIFEARRTLAEYTEGRTMSCDQICRTVSDGDKRALRSRRARAHLRHCPACAAFAQAIPARSAALRALTPTLPPAAGAGILARVMGGSGSAGGSHGAATTGLVGKAAASLAAGKAAAGVAVVSATLGAVAVLKADRPVAHGRGDVARAKMNVAATAPQATKPLLSAAISAAPGLTGRRSESAQKALTVPAARAHDARVSKAPARSPALPRGSSSAPLTGTRASGPTTSGSSRRQSHESGYEAQRPARPAPAAAGGSPAGASRGRGNAAAHGQRSSGDGPGGGRAAAPPGRQASSARSSLVLQATPAPSPPSAAAQLPGRLGAGARLGASSRSK